ncbi:flagellar hook-associated protein FlgL [Priestia abyssalis]|uniref:flagellar hook-associated protein FlgL n=1 Tax=Priestia abyssalis TaxID=1221450 RepID=UPI001F3D54A8|nr:flagellar hook-associated protein FlgL [Priestia abyssalis]
MMRITQGMLSNNMLRNLNQSYSKLIDYQNQVSTGKKITRPSDNPTVAVQAMGYRTNLTEIEQFKTNFSKAYSSIDNADTALDDATQALQRIRELTVQASNDTNNTENRQAIENEINELKEHLMDIANTKVGDHYIFNGGNTKTAPVAVVDGKTVNTGTEGEPITIELAKGLSMPVSIKGSEVFSNDFFQNIEELQEKLKAGVSGEELNTYLAKIDANSDAVSTARSELGAKYNRIEVMEARTDEQEITFKRLLSDTEDVEFEKALIDLQTQTSVHQAALAVGSKVIQPTLMDFLR